MNLRAFASYSRTYDSLPVFDKEEKTQIGLLGLTWNTLSDKISLKDNIKQDIALPICTRRSVLKTIASILDPLGFFCPWVLEAKMFLQSTVKETKNWDEELIHRTPYWLKIRQNLSLSSKFDIKRSLYHTDVLHYELHIFSDASAESYGACAYLRQVCENENIIDLIFAKQRLKPVNKDRLTIPRLELMGALIGCRILNFLRGCIQKEISATYLWCDSKCVLGWLRSNKILPAFVERRVTEIKRSKIDFLAYVASESNPADLLTRIQNDDDLEQNNSWWHGSSFFREANNTWTLDSQFEVDNDSSESPVFIINTETSSDKDTLLTPFELTLENFSSFKKLIKVTKFCLTFIQKPQTNAVHMWIKYVQNLHFYKEKSILLTRNKNKLYSTNLVTQLGLWIDSDGIIRCGGRLKNISPNTDTAYPTRKTLSLHQSCDQALS